MVWWQYIILVCVFTLGKVIACYSILVPQICVNFGIPFAKEIESYTGISTGIIRARYRRSILFWFVINTIALIAELKFLPTPYFLAYALGTATIIFNIGETKRNKTNICEFLETNKKFFSDEDYEKILLYVIDKSYIERSDVE